MNSLNNKLSIITATFNSETTLSKTIETVKNCTYPSIEFIVIDGASNDDTVNIIKKNTNIISHWISEPDKGIPDALNKGLKIATGKWLYFLSSDDQLFEPNQFDFLLHEENKDYDMIYGNVLKLPSEQLYDGEFNTHKILQRDICHQAQVFNKSFFNKLGNFNIRYKYASDWVLNIQAYANPQIKIKYIDKTLACFFENGRTSYNIDVNFIKDSEKLFSLLIHTIGKKAVYTYLMSGVYSLLKRKQSYSFLRFAKILFYTKNSQFLLDYISLFKQTYLNKSTR